VREGEKLSADPRWVVVGTGGGCTALSRPVQDGGNPDEAGFWFITAEASAPETVDEPVMLGLFDANGDGVGYWDCKNVWDALAIANGFRDPTSPGYGPGSRERK
jgi:hypothetical protein